mmetsp:Transcript_24609/g.34730  ORF Transcript_24609/g.34730 Transcript_24609/m.34730 type:complete len:283 (-) Transcript_24609:255-1103(-)
MTMATKQEHQSATADKEEKSSLSSGIEILNRLKAEPFNQQTNHSLEHHPYVKAAENGTLTLQQRQAFAKEQYYIQSSDAISFAALAGHVGFVLTTTLSNVAVPELPQKEKEKLNDHDEEDVGVDLFQFLLGGEIYAAPLLLKYAESVHLDEEALMAHRFKTSAKAQAYPSYWARLALSNNRAAGAAACAVNFPAWGEMCDRLYKAILGKDHYGYNDKNSRDGDNVENEGLAFIKFFATPIERLDEMAAKIIEEEGAKYEDLVEHVRLLQEYEVMFWDAIFED